MPRIMTSAALFAVLMAAAPAAFAEGNTAALISRSVKVSYADLDLSREAGARTLFQRLKAASRRTCGNRPSPKLIAASVRYEACLEGAMSRAVTAIDSPLVTALLDRRNALAKVATR